MTYVLDTSAVLAHFRKESGWERVQSLAEDSDAIILLASLSLTEFGRRLQELGFPAAEVDDTVARYAMLFSEIVPIDEAVALRALTISRSAVGRVPLVDCLIAAAASVRQACLVHRDRHFGFIGRALLKQLDLGERLPEKELERQ